MTGTSSAAQVFELPDDLSAEARLVLETMGSARAVRYFEPEAVPTELLETLVWAGTRASSPDNSQSWDFVVVGDAKQKELISSAIAPFLETIKGMDPVSDDVRSRTRSGAVHLISHLADVPALIFVCGRDNYPSDVPEEKYMWGALHAASQNMVVAGRSLGLSVVLTMLHIAAPGKLRTLLNLPSDVRIGSVMAVGKPARPFGPVNRRSISEVMHYDRW